jgi:hypothetical protein
VGMLSRTWDVIDFPSSGWEQCLYFQVPLTVNYLHSIFNNKLIIYVSLTKDSLTEGVCSAFEVSVNRE